MGKFIMNGVPYGGGDVEANPSGTATDTLTKLGIEGTVYEIQGGGGGSNLIVDAQIYSTEEREVGVWTDGKPLYQKTYRNVTITNNSDNIVDANLSGITLVSYDLEWSGLTNNKSDFQNQVIDTLFLDNRGLVYYFVRSGTWWHGCDTADITVQYTKDSDTAGSGGYQAYGFSPIIYSTEEREVGVWTDNKPLYEITYEFTLTSTNHALALTGLNIDTFVEAQGFLRYQAGNEDQSVPYPYYAGASYYSAGYFNRNNQNYYVQSSSDSVTYYNKARITFKYTKTTDTVGSGQYTTLGVPAHHYDGEEKIIGTWFGETLYEKTYTYSGTYDGLTTFETDIPITHKIVNVIGRNDYVVGGQTYTVMINSPYAQFPYDIANNHYVYKFAISSQSLPMEIKMTVQYTKTS